MAGGDARQAQLVGQADERRQAQRVAVDAGIRRLAGEVAALERSHDDVLELGLEVEDVMRKAELRGGRAARCRAPGEQQLRRSVPGHSRAVAVSRLRPSSISLSAATALSTPPLSATSARALLGVP